MVSEPTRQPAIPHRLSIVVPVYDEAHNVEPLLHHFEDALREYPSPWELIVVDDGSTDTTAALLREHAARHGDHIRLVPLQRNFGQSAAMQAGIDAARGDIIVTMDGDLQNDAADIPHMVDTLLEQDLDLVAGWRKSRKDSFWLRTVPSKVANSLIGRVTGVKLHDYGCTLKVFRASVLANVRLYGEMHRFIPAWVAKYTAPQRIGEVEVTHHPRRYGQSKYGISRTFRVLLDLLAVLFFLRYSARPGHFFGTFGLISGGIGAAMLTYLLVLKLLGEDIGARPMLLAGLLLVVVGVQFVTTGVLSELLARIYYESGRAGSRTYVVRTDGEETKAGWRRPG